MKYGLLIFGVATSTLVGCGKKETVQSLELSPPPKDFISPDRFLKFRLEAASDILGVEADEYGNIEIITDKYRTQYFSSDGVINYAEIYLLETTPCSQTERFDPVVVLNAINIDMNRLDEATRMTHLATYYDHQEKLKVSVICDPEDWPIAVRFSHKYYGH